MKNTEEFKEFKNEFNQLGITKEKEQKEGAREKQAVSQSSREIPITLAMYTYIKIRLLSSGQLL